MKPCFVFVLFFRRTGAVGPAAGGEAARQARSSRFGRRSVGPTPAPVGGQDAGRVSGGGGGGGGPGVTARRRRQRRQDALRFGQPQRSAVESNVVPGASHIPVAL